MHAPFHIASHTSAGSAAHGMLTVFAVISVLMHHPGFASPSRHTSDSDSLWNAVCAIKCGCFSAIDGLDLWATRAGGWREDSLVQSVRSLSAAVSVMPIEDRDAVKVRMDALVRRVTS
jgi:hypothetical protein